jgi:hypothetical protein
LPHNYGGEAVGVKKTKDRYRKVHGGAQKREGIPSAHSRRDVAEAETANIRYFLHALNQMSLALHALGYAREGAALVKVKAELNNRLFDSSGKIAEVAQLLN